MGQNVGPITQVNPPTASGPATAVTPPANMGGARMSPSPQTTSQAGAGGVPGAVPGKDANDAMIIQALIAYLRKKVL